MRLRSPAVGNNRRRAVAAASRAESAGPVSLGSTRPTLAAAARLLRPGRGRDVPEHPQGAVHRLAVGEGSRDVGLEDHEVGSGASPPKVLPPDAPLEFVQVVLRAEVVGGIVSGSARHTGVARAAWRAGRR